MTAVILGLPSVLKKGSADGRLSLHVSMTPTCRAHLALRMLHTAYETAKAASMLGGHKLLAMGALRFWGCSVLVIIALLAAAYACMLAWQWFSMP